MGNPFFSPLRPASARPGHGRQAGPIFFSPPRAGQGMPVGLPLFWTKYPISHWFYKVFCDFRLQVESAFEQNTPFSIAVISFFAISASRWNPLLSKIPHFLLVSGCFCGDQNLNISQNTLFSQRFLGVLRILAELPGPCRIPDLARFVVPISFSPLRPAQPMAQRRHPFFSPAQE